ncbi:MAG: hypothetical protein LBE83_09110, partial [Propionibacteriaceae bacterium]|nr:hypothetical protein [Propionibacteriaceae bacterium]
MAHYDLALIGLGNVNRTLAEVIHTDGTRLATEMGFTLRVTAICDLRWGQVVDPAGVDLGAVLSLAP